MYCPCKGTQAQDMQCPAWGEIGTLGTPYSPSQHPTIGCAEGCYLDVGCVLFGIS